MTSAGGGPLCFIKSKVNEALYKILEHFMFPSLDKLYGDLYFIFQRGVSPVPSAKSTTTCFQDPDITLLD